jgi:hypothetical protein
MEHTANEHHLVMGELKDVLTGNMLPDTHDEQYRQKIGRLLLDKRGFQNRDIRGRFVHTLAAGEQKAQMKIDYLVRHQGRWVILIRYAPGSLVTRRLSTLALSRTIAGYQIPIVVVTNGEDAEVIDGDTGRVMAEGLEMIPSFDQIEERFDSFSFRQISASVFEQASRIAYACEIDGACPCDTDVCKLE